MVFFAGALLFESYLHVFCCQNLEFDIREREPHYTMLLTKGDHIIQGRTPGSRAP